MTTPNKPAPWHGRARQKYYALAADAAGLRAAMSTSYERLAQLRRDMRAVQMDQERLGQALAWNGVLPGRDAERNRSVDRLADYAAEIERLQAVEGEVLKNLKQITARSEMIGPLTDRCASLLVSLHLLDRSEVSL